MPDWSITPSDPDFCDAVERFPPPAECEYWQTGDLCGHSDCNECGPDVAKHLLTEARAGFPGLMRLAREVGRISDKYGSNIPDGPVVVGDVANLCSKSVFGCTWHRLCWYDYAACCAWADGIVDAVHGTPAPIAARDCFVTDYERWCYFLGRVAPALHRLHNYLRAREAMADAQEVK
jgi:hypothetical protein